MKNKSFLFFLIVFNSRYCFFLLLIYIDFSSTLIVYISNFLWYIVFFLFFTITLIVHVYFFFDIYFTVFLFFEREIIYLDLFTSYDRVSCSIDTDRSSLIHIDCPLCLSIYYFYFLFL